MNARAWVMTALVSMVIAGLSGGCAADPCDEVKDRCGNCTDPNQQLSCEFAVGLDHSDSCDAMLDDATFTDSCPL